MLDLTSPGALKLLAEQIKTDIDKFCVEKWNDGPRSHLGASQIGHSCTQYLWMQFRWLTHKVESGRQYRLFQRGHFEEPRFTMYLEGVGCTVRTLAKLLWYHPESDTYFIDDADMQEKRQDLDAQLCIDVTYDFNHNAEAEKRGVKFDKGKAQIRISGCSGHFGGSLDSEIILPERYNLSEPVLFLGEYKTQGTKKFNELVSSGCKIKKYQHFCQQSMYGYKRGYKYGIYLVVNKNDDDLYIEVVPLDWTLGKQLEERAERIIFSQKPLEKIAASPDYFECKWCNAKDVCWSGKPCDKNCRSCYHCKPVEDANWQCDKYGIVPKEYIPKGCGDWVGII